MNKAELVTELQDRYSQWQALFWTKHSTSAADSARIAGVFRSVSQHILTNSAQVSGTIAAVRRQSDAVWHVQAARRPDNCRTSLEIPWSQVSSSTIA